MPIWLLISLRKESKGFDIVVVATIIDLSRFEITKHRTKSIAS